MARNPKVIIIDQDPNTRAETQRMLALSGFAVMGAAGYGMEAITLARETTPEAVVIALEEPIARSLQTIEAVADVLPQTPIVAYSSISDPSVIRRAMQIGVKDYLIAPLKDEDLSHSIHEVLAQEERRQQRLTGEVEPQAYGTVLTIFGAKGGIGKTTIATNVAAALVQRTNQSVALVDLDTRFGDVAILMDIPTDRSIADLALPDDEIDREAVHSCLYTHGSGVAILPAPIRPSEWHSVHPGHIEKMVTVLATTHDYVILDTPGAFNDIVTRALEMSTIVLLIATLDLASLKDTILALEMLRSWSFPAEKIKIVINHTNDTHGDSRIDVRRILGKEVFWSIPYDRNISQATQLGTPIVVAKPKSKASESFIELACAVSGIRLRPKGMLERLGERIAVIGAGQAEAPSDGGKESPERVVESPVKEAVER
ncbi:MAG: AAA family ATPase [Chloroflexota bacterium]|nr:AAA family ATPase [Chloroflexota bacterium]